MKQQKQEKKEKNKISRAVKDNDIKCVYSEEMLEEIMKGVEQEAFEYVNNSLGKVKGSITLDLCSKLNYYLDIDELRNDILCVCINIQEYMEDIKMVKKEKNNIGNDITSSDISKTCYYLLNKYEEVCDIFKRWVSKRKELMCYIGENIINFEEISEEKIDEKLEELNKLKEDIWKLKLDKWRYRLFSEIDNELNHIERVRKTYWTTIDFFPEIKNVSDKDIEEYKKQKREYYELL